MHTRLQILLAVLVFEVGVVSGQVLDAYSTNVSAAIRPSSVSTVRKVLLKKKKAAKTHPGPTQKPVIQKKSKRAILQEAASTSEAPKTRVIAVPAKAGCGDKLVLETETCDDGNTVSGDGCSSACSVETGFLCNGQQPSVCWFTRGDGIVSSKEQCDDGNTAVGDGCGADGKVQSDYTCTGSPSVCTAIPFCGNLKVEGSETCDDGNTENRDGCSSACAVES